MGLGIFEEAFLQELGGFIGEGIGGDIEEDYARTYVCSEDGLSTHVSSPFVLCVFTPLSRPGEVKSGAHSVIVCQSCSAHGLAALKRPCQVHKCPVLAERFYINFTYIV